MGRRQSRALRNAAQPFDPARAGGTGGRGGPPLHFSFRSTIKNADSRRANRRPHFRLNDSMGLGNALAGAGRKLLIFKEKYFLSFCDGVSGFGLRGHGCAGWAVVLGVSLATRHWRSGFRWRLVEALRPVTGVPVTVGGWWGRGACWLGWGRRRAGARRSQGGGASLKVSGLWAGGEWIRCRQEWQHGSPGGARRLLAHATPPATPRARWLAGRSSPASDCLVQTACFRLLELPPPRSSYEAGARTAPLPGRPR
jgi:hypothetical protein